MNTKSLFIAALLPLFFLGDAKEAVKAPASAVPQPVTLKDTGIRKIKDFAGEWIAYWMQYNRITSKLNTKFILTQNGEWYVSIDGAPPEKKGSWRLVDEFLLLKPIGASEKNEMLAKLVDQDHFLMQSETQPNLAVVYRRASTIKQVAQTQIQGSWRFTELRPNDRKKRQSPFLLNFDGAGHGYSAGQQLSGSQRSGKRNLHHQRGFHFLEKRLQNSWDLEQYEISLFLWQSDSGFQKQLYLRGKGIVQKNSTNPAF